MVEHSPQILEVEKKKKKAITLSAVSLFIQAGLRSLLHFLKNKKKKERKKEKKRKEKPHLFRLEILK